MLLEEIGRKLETMDKSNSFSCYVENDILYARFKTRKNCIVEIFTPYEKQLLKSGKFTEENLLYKLFELKQIANFKD